VVERRAIRPARPEVRPAENDVGAERREPVPERVALGRRAPGRQKLTACCGPHEEIRRRARRRSL
jgi:hypothetical protein